MDATALIILLVMAFVGLAIFLVVVPLILRLSCWICRVKQPRFLKTIGIVCVNELASAAIFLFCYFLIRLASGAGLVAAAPGGGINVDEEQRLTSVASLVPGILVSAGIYRWMIPTSFGKGVLIRLTQLIAGFLIACAVLRFMR